MEPQRTPPKSFARHLGRKLLTTAPLIACAMYGYNVFRTLTLRHDPPLSETLANDVFWSIATGCVCALTSAAFDWRRDRVAAKLPRP